jgi:tetraacyldisaccharide 4'-kinase
VLPLGRLREARDAAARAHFLVVSDATAGAAAAEAWALGIQESCGFARGLGEEVSIVPRASCLVPRAGCQVPGAGCQVPGAGCQVLAVAGIANPQRFFDALKANYNIVETMSFGDHHRYTAADVAAIAAKVKVSGADVVLTTDKDAVRLEAFELPFAACRVPLRVEFDPPDALMASVMAVLR